MSSSLLQILAGVFGLIESPLDPKLFCRLAVYVRDCVFVLTCMARYEVLSKDKDKQKDTHSSWNALGKFALQPCRLHSEFIRKLLISYYDLLAHH